MTEAPVETTHCANCGGGVPVDRPHKVGECRAPTDVLDFVEVDMEPDL